MAWVGTWGQVELVKKAKTRLPYDITHRTPQMK